MTKKTERVGFWLLFGLLFLTPLLVSITVHEPFTVPKTLFLHLMVTLLACWWLVQGVEAKKLSLPQTPLFLSMYTLFIWRAITLLWATHRSTGAELLFSDFILLLLVIVACRLKERRLIIWLISAAVAAGVITATFALMQYYGVDGQVLEAVKVDGWFDLTYLVKPIRPGSRPYLHGLCGNRNHLVGYLIGLVPVLLSYSLSNNEERSFGPKLVSFFTLLLFSVVIMLSYCRGAWLSLSLGLLLFAYLTKKLKVLLSLAIAGAILIVVFGSPLISPVIALLGLVAATGGAFWILFPSIRGKRFYFTFGLCLLLALVGGNFFEGKNPLSRAHYSVLKRMEKLMRVDESGPLARRLEMVVSWKMATNSFKSAIVGRGFGQYGILYQRVQAFVLERPENAHFLPKVGHTSRAHNELMNRWCEEGFVGLIFLLLLTYHFCKTFLKTEALRNDWLLQGILLSLVTLTTHSMFSYALHKPSVAALFFVLLACAHSLVKGKSFELRWQDKSLSALIALVGLCMAIGVTNCLFTRYEAEHSWAKAIDLERAGQTAQSIIQMRRAVNLAPNLLDLQFAYGVSLMKSQQWESALEVFEKIDFVKALPESSFNRAICLLQLVRPEEAKEQLRKALYFRPGFESAVAGLTQMSLQEDNLTEAREVLETALKTNPYSAKLLQLKARVEAKQGKSEEARLTIMKAISSNDHVPISIHFDAMILNLRRLVVPESLASYFLLVKKLGESKVRSQMPAQAKLTLDYYRVAEQRDMPQSLNALTAALLQGTSCQVEHHTRVDVADVYQTYLDKNPGDVRARLAQALVLARVDKEKLPYSVKRKIEQGLKEITEDHKLKPLAQSLLGLLKEGAP